MSIPIQVITLNPDSSSVCELQAELKKQGLEAQITIGVDGRLGTPKLIDDERIDQTLSRKMRMVELHDSEVGCYLSHYRLIKQSYKNGCSRICILEDDVLIEPSFAKVLAAIHKLSDVHEFVRLMGLKQKKRKVLQLLAGNHRLIRPHKGLCGTQGYIINRAGMKKVIQEGHQIAEPIDKFYDHYWEFGLKCFCVEPHIIWERNYTQSSIVKESRQRATKSLPARIRKHVVKLSRGFKRRRYIAKRISQFYPAAPQKSKIGKTLRIR